MPKTAKELMEELYSKLQSSLIAVPAGAKPTSTVALQYPGILIPTDDQEATTMDVCGLMNEILTIDVVRNPTSRKLSSIYQRILNADLPHSSAPPDEEGERNCKEASAYINKNMKAYNEFQIKYAELSDKYQLKRSQRSREANLLSVKLKSLMNEWQASGKEEFEHSQDILREYKKSSPATIFKIVQAKFDACGGADAIEQSIQFIPYKWINEDGLTWTHIDLGQTSQHGSTTTAHSQMDQTITEITKRSGFFNTIVNWFKPQKEESGTTRIISDEEKIGEHMDYSNMQISFDVAVVTVLRDWFDLSILDIQGVTLQGTSAGGISTGMLSPDNNGAMPAYISGFILAKNIVLKMDVDANTKQYLHSVVHKDTNNSYSCGPFRMDSKAKIQESKSDKASDNDKATVTIEAGESKQIIGYINTVIPKYPLS